MEVVSDEVEKIESFDRDRISNGLSPRTGGFLSTKDLIWVDMPNSALGPSWLALSVSVSCREAGHIAAQRMSPCKARMSPLTVQDKDTLAPRPD